MAGPPRKGRSRWAARAQNRWLWAGFAAPGIIWLALLFIVPFYTVLAIAGGQLNTVFESPEPVWNPLHWTGANYTAIFHDLVGQGAFVGPIFLRTLVYVAVASVLSLLIAYPAAYFVTQFAGRRKVLFLALLIAPFWISYMMRMLAWIDLLQTDGYVNRVLVDTHLISQPVNWLGGLPATVILGLVYGYIPYLILVLYAGLDRIDQRLLEAGRDLGLNRSQTFLRITLPLSRQAILTGMLITVLPMVGDYFTNQLLSGASSTAMIGNVIDSQLNNSTQEAQGAALSLMLLVLLLIPMTYYVLKTRRASEEAF
jgi:ABC-type spermidine/putrescine transport system permease subunit I